MIKISTIGYPRIGPKRELKKVLELFWKGKISENELEKTAKELRKQNWQVQKANGVDLISSNDFSFYDQVLDTICLLGAIPKRYKWDKDKVSLKTYFAMSRGSQDKELDVPALEMTKWFDTNYHYLVPEFSADQTFSLSSNKPFNEFNEAKSLGYITKPIILGPLSFLLLGKSDTQSFKTLNLLDKILPIYKEVIGKLSDLGAEWIQIDEPILVKDLDEEVISRIKPTLNELKKASKNSKILITTYFESLDKKIHEKLSTSDIDAIHLDLVRGTENKNYIQNANKVLSLGIIDGRNIWKSDLNNKIKFLQQSTKSENEIIISTSCSLLYCPYDLDLEKKVPQEIKRWLSFSKQKLNELNLIKTFINEGDKNTNKELEQNKLDILDRQNSKLIHDSSVKKRLKTIDSSITKRKSSYSQRSKIQQDIFKLPKFPTTTIGSFPQTQDVRQARAKFKRGELDNESYKKFLKDKTIDVIKKQEEIDIDVVVHGEFERNDMVEYFGEYLKGFTFSSSGWVQSYGSRCVKPPIIYGDISRSKAMTVYWSKFAQEQTKKIVKGMLTGPITILQWSFVRDDQPRKSTTQEIAFAIRDEVKDLEQNGIKIIQIDEPALREGLPLKKEKWKNYLDWSVECFRIASSVVKDETQIHTHMCYGEFDDIIDSIAALEADVISIETSRSRMELLKTFEKFKYPNEIGPGVFDIHSPRVPSTQEMTNLLTKAIKNINKDKIWVNPDCGLKTRGWPETINALQNMVLAAKNLRKSLS
ncbi:MAG: 5-methyltetrahydropteroyltriglutamate--homocysteine S-methyltransferase [Pelagibacteraceae bacterium]|jgi:5-methyltetrahydropteroyltriglutamate--homocysteine methyltransferase|nr:5-methyltetrahydropteroyltriglutamate--homocysteine S-methyltransferase [Pelagibacteraceae bacterium]